MTPKPVQSNKKSKMMIRSVKFYIIHANKAKLQYLNEVMVEYNRLVNVFINELYSIESLPKYPKLKTDTWLSANLVRDANYQALAICKSARESEKRYRYRRFKKAYAKALKHSPHRARFLASRFSEYRLRYKRVPVYKKLVMDLSSVPFADYSLDTRHFSEFVRISRLISIESRRNGYQRYIKLPLEHHRLYNRYLKAGWRVKRALRIEWRDNQLIFSKMLEKEAPSPRQQPLQALGIDLGLNKLITDSNGDIYGAEFKAMLNALQRKEQGSKSWHRQLQAIKNYINHEVKGLAQTLNDKGYNALVAENLRYLTLNTRSRLNKQTRRLLHHWNLRQVYDRLENHCELQGLHFARVSPSYTSRTCPVCNYRDKRNRNGEQFHCLKCEYQGDADKVGATNILARFLAESSVRDDSNPLSMKLKKGGSIYEL